MSAEPAAKPAPKLWLLVLLALSGTLAMHIFVPALPAAAQDLGAGKAAMQSTISLYILGLAGGQLVYGPLSDGYGRRPALLIGLALYAAASLGAAFAGGVQTLVAARLLQAFGGCAGLVIGRAIVRDTAAPTDAVRRLAMMNLALTVGPGLAPIVGGAISATLGWRFILLGLSALGVVTMLLAARYLPETGQPTGTLSARILADDYRRLLGSRAFLGFAVGGGCATTSMYAFIAAAPFIFTEDLHQPPQAVGLYLAVLIVGVSVGSVLATRLVRVLPIERLMVGANLLSVFGALTFLVSVLLGHASVPTVVGSMLLFTLGAGMASPAALTKAVSVDPKVVGSAAGLYGFTQMAIGALCTSLAGLGAEPAFASAAVLVAAGIVAQVAFWIALHDDRRGLAP